MNWLVWQGLTGLAGWETMNGQNLTLENNPQTKEPDVKVSRESKKA